MRDIGKHRHGRLRHAGTVPDAQLARGFRARVATPSGVPRSMPTPPVEASAPTGNVLASLISRRTLAIALFVVLVGFGVVWATYTIRYFDALGGQPQTQVAP